MNQGCSTNSNLPINRPSSNIQAFAPASISPANIADVTENQPISVDDLDMDMNIDIDIDKQKTETKDEVLEEPKLNYAEGAIRNMSDTSDFMPEEKSYWM